ncbi:MAG: cupredoxin family copper-binding protein [Chloroflexi bacterium]|nr:cupredoxin family copper-binding protein [Chloroflexota bacterium]
MHRAAPYTLIVAVAILAAAAGIIAGVALMAVAMSGHWGMMGSGMMGRGSSGEDQPAIVSTANEITVEIRDFTFTPGNLTVDAGTRITWVNRDSAPHTATDRAGDWDTGGLDKDESASLVFDSPGTYSYYCVYHPDMTASLKVR